MSETLSQAEIDDLVNALHSGNVSDEALSEQSKPKIRAYDFRKPNKFSKEQISTFQVIYGNYARSLGTFLSVSLRSTFHATLLSIEQVTYDEFIHSLFNPSVSIIFNPSPLRGSAVLEIPSALAFIMLERMMGGRGSTSSWENRALTEIEISLMENLGQEILDLSEESWENILKLNPRIEHIETNPQFVQVVSPGEMVLLISIECRVGNVSGVLQYCFPYLVVEPVLSKFSTRFWFETGKRESPEDYHDRIKKRLSSVKLPLRVILGETSITVGELTGLQVGDVVMLNRKRDQDLDLVVGGHSKYAVRPGLYHNKLAVKITAVKAGGI